MNNNYHKLELVSNTKEFLEKISSLPLHSMNKLLLCNNCVLSKLAWRLTNSYIELTWVKHNLDTLLVYFVRSWLEIQVSATIDIALLSKDIFGLNIVNFPRNFCKVRHQYGSVCRIWKTMTLGKFIS